VQHNFPRKVAFARPRSAHLLPSEYKVPKAAESAVGSAGETETRVERPLPDTAT